MQFFHLFSFVVVASYAAALPQPAELSEKYSSNVDTNLATGLEARSYQPALNSQKNPATLMSLERRANSGSGSSPSFVKVPKRPLNDPFTSDEFSSEKLAFMIDHTRNGLTGLFNKGELAEKKIGKYAGGMLASYTRKDAYVNVLLFHWMEFVSTNVVNFIKSGLGDDKFSVVGPEIVKKIGGFKNTFDAGLKVAADATSNILNDEGTVIENVKKIRTGFNTASSACAEFFSELKFQLLKFRAGWTLSRHLANAIESVNRFHATQFEGYRRALRALGDKSS
ncbi:hypothetical protein BASA83_000469 [Batrachochytrium salamandrivorans]|nr:hypothetical protein BASA81_013380 [Batrachochytrium salamandrivorans]KAH9276955.1 hypothetical protein BASA83_000469 [Batrachochytrium salamandrivorans]